MVVVGVWVSRIVGWERVRVLGRGRGEFGQMETRAGRGCGHGYGCRCKI